MAAYTVSTVRGKTKGDLYLPEGLPRVTDTPCTYNSPR